MKKLLLVLLMPAGFIGAMQQQTKIVILRNLINETGVPAKITLYENGKKQPGTHIVAPQKTKRLDWHLQPNNRVTVETQSALREQYVPTAQDSIIDIVISPFERGERTSVRQVKK